VVIDETYSADPLNYTSATLESGWSLTPKEAASVPAFAHQRVRGGRWAAGQAPAVASFCCC
jgi:hypothetical protein